MYSRDNIIEQGLRGVLHLLYPDLCAGCGSEEVLRNQLICLDCIANLPLTGFFNHSTNPVEKLFRGRINIESAAAYVYFTKQSSMQHLLHQLKYKGNKEVGLYFGRKMGAAMKSGTIYNDIEALLPLPLYYQREKRRGYNQAAIICEGIAEVTGAQVLYDVVERKVKTETQTQKNRNERWQNIEGKFSLRNKAQVMGKHVMLVDDVLTTGATLEACGAELLKTENLRLSISTL
ncbi:MAG: phosphoribosyltransferase family protein, partial [Flavitalea sp.]